jgi:hypothetical protein
MSTTNDVFFNIPCPYRIYLEPLQQPASEVLLQEKMPQVFQLLSRIAQQETDVFTHINQLPKGDILTEYLSLQSKKVDLVLHQQLSLLPQEGLLCEGTHFGGSHLTFVAPKHFDLKQHIAGHVLIQQHLVAVYCFIEPLEIISLGDTYEIKAEIIEIADSDREILIKASLQQQYRLLYEKKKAKLSN